MLEQEAQSTNYEDPNTLPVMQGWDVTFGDDIEC